MPTLNLDHLATFRLVISRGSFSGAAEVLGLSQPAVSLQVRQLEQTLGLKLLDRTGKGIRATDAGRTWLEQSEAIEQVVSRAMLSVARHKEDINGSVIIGCGATACIHLMPPLLQQLREHHPQLSIGVRTGNTRDIVRAVEENRIDVGLVTLPAVGSNISVTPVLADAFVAIAASDDWAPDTVVTSTLLCSLPLIVFETGSNTRQLIDSWLATGTHRSLPIMELGSIEAIKRMVRAGLGYSIVPQMSVSAGVDSTGLAIFPLMPALHRDLGIVMRQDRIMSRGMSEVVKGLSALSTVAG